MSKTSLDRVIDLAEQVATQLGLSIVEARLSQQGRIRSLEVTIHRAGGRISLDDCETVSRQLEELLDEQHPPLIEGSYLLEVQSPGIDRKLKTEREYAVFAGEPVEVQLKHSLDGLGAHFKGVLSGFESGELLIDQLEVVVASGKKKRKRAGAAARGSSLPESLRVPPGALLQLRRYPAEPPPDESGDRETIE